MRHSILCAILLLSGYIYSQTIRSNNIEELYYAIDSSTLSSFGFVLYDSTLNDLLVSKTLYEIDDIQNKEVVENIRKNSGKLMHVTCFNDIVYSDSLYHEILYGYALNYIIGFFSRVLPEGFFRFDVLFNKQTLSNIKVNSEDGKFFGQGVRYSSQIKFGDFELQLVRFYDFMRKQYRPNLIVLYISKNNHLIESINLNI